MDSEGGSNRIFIVFDDCWETSEYTQSRPEKFSSSGHIISIIQPSIAPVGETWTLPERSSKPFVERGYSKLELFPKVTTYSVIQSDESRSSSQFSNE